MAQLQQEGVAIDCGNDTRHVYEATVCSFDCDAGVMLTASHLPYYFNGIKIFSRQGGAEKTDIHYILTHTTVHEAAEKETISKKTC